MRCWVRLYWVAVVAIIDKIPAGPSGSRPLFRQLQRRAEEGFGIEGEGHLALLVGVVAPRDLQGPLDALGLHHDPEAGGTAASLHRNPYHLATPPLTAERRLSAAQGEGRARLARDTYTYLHLPTVAGIIFAALGIEQTLAHGGEPLGTIPAVAPCSGVALYLLGHNAFRLRDEGSVSVPRLVVMVVCLALIPVGVSVSSILTLAVLTVLLCGLAAFETAPSREFRRELRAR